MKTPELEMLPAATILRIKTACDAEGLDIVAFAWNVQRAVMDAWAASEHNPLNYPPLPSEVDDVRITWRGETEFARAEDYYYTQDQMRSYGAACSAAAREEVMKALKPSAEVMRSDPLALHGRIKWLGKPAPMGALLYSSWE